MLRDMAKILISKTASFGGSYDKVWRRSSVPTRWILGQEIFGSGRSEALYGSWGWDNRRIKQRPNPPNSATIAPEHSV